MKKALAIILSVCMIAALTITVSADDRDWVDGMTLSGGSEWCGAIIDTAEVGLVKGSNYVLEFAVSFDWAGDGLRVRYSNWDGEGSWTNSANDGAGHSTDAAKFNSGNVASQIPAELPAQTGGTQIFTVNFKFGADAAGDFDNMDNTEFINIFGHSGFDGYEVLGMRLKDSSGAVLAEIGEFPDADGANGENGENGGNGANGGTPPDGSKPVDTGIADVAVASAIALVAVGAVVFSRKRK